jgi:hypothetical protein
VAKIDTPIGLWIIATILWKLGITLVAIPDSRHCQLDFRLGYRRKIKTQPNPIDWKRPKIALAFHETNGHLRPTDSC